jgi:hypothetical protein
MVSDVEIRFEWQTSGEFVSNHFTLQKHYRSGAGLVWNEDVLKMAKNILLPSNQSWKNSRGWTWGNKPHLAGYTPVLLTLHFNNLI